MKDHINISIPKRSIWSALALILVGIFAYFQIIGYLIPGFQEICSMKKETAKITDVGLIWVPVIAFGLMEVTVCLTVNIFKKLNDHDERGLILAMYLAGFLFGCIGGIIGFLMLGIIWGINGELTAGLITGLTWGLIVGLIAGLIMGLIIGFQDEFK